MIELQDDVPLPEVTREQPRRKYPFEEMAVGQCFFVPERTVKSMSSYVSRETKDLDAKFTTRKVWLRKPLPTEDQSLEWVKTTEETPGAVPGVGVWRTE